MPAAIYIYLVMFIAFVLILWLRHKQNKKKKDICDEPAGNLNQEELRRYRHLREIHLSEPLTERMRPKNFSAVIGQKDGIEALKAALAVENPQHIIIYGPPGVGKTAAARLALDYAKSCPASPFGVNAPFIEIDGATSRFDERGIADPLLGSVHDPIYQGAGQLGSQGIPQPKPGAVNNAHGGVLFIDEIGELHHTQINKLLKVMEDRKVMPESAYYNPYDRNIPEYIHDLFKNGLPADFRLIGATTRNAGDLPEALRSRCVEIYFRSLQPSEIAEIAVNAAKELELGLSEGTLDAVCRYAKSGRDAVNILQLAKGFCNSIVLYPETVERIAQIAHYEARSIYQPCFEMKIGCCQTLGQGIGGCIIPINIEAEAFPSEQGQLIISASDSSAENMEILKGIVLKAITAVKRVTSLNTDEYDIHINFELAGSRPDASYELAAAAAIFSACCGKYIKPALLLCGELHISGELIVIKEAYAKCDFISSYPDISMLSNSIVPHKQIECIKNLSECFSKIFCAPSAHKVINLDFGKQRLRDQISGAEQ